MTRDQAVWLAVGVLALLCLALLVALVRVRAASRRAAYDVARLREALEELAATRRAPAPVPAPTQAVEYVITGLGEPAPEPTRGPARIDGPAFADLVLRETVVKAASLLHGVRRGLAPASRNRIRFEMRQEVRRSRKQRRADLRLAQRDLRARQRAALAEEAS